MLTLTPKRSCFQRKKMLCNGKETQIVTCVCTIVFYLCCIMFFAEITVAQLQQCIKLCFFFTSNKTEAKTDPLIGWKINSQGIILESLRLVSLCLFRVHQYVFRCVEMTPYLSQYVSTSEGKVKLLSHYLNIRGNASNKKDGILYIAVVLSCWSATQNRLRASGEKNNVSYRYDQCNNNKMQLTK